jgi:hypothetical protein
MLIKSLRKVRITILIYKKLKCAYVGKWINKMWYIHTMEYYSAFKRKEVLTHATISMNLEDILLSDMNQSQKNKHTL